MYTVKSISDDGVYYLYKGWGNRCSAWRGIMFSKMKPSLPKHLFKTQQSAKASITKLLKVIYDEYKDDTFEIIEVCGKHQ